MCFFHASFNCWLTANYSHSGISAYVFLACCTSGWDCTFLQAGICLTYMFEKTGDRVRLIFFQLTRGSQAEIKRENNHEDKRGKQRTGNEGKDGKMKIKGLLESGNRERANIFDENATLASTVWFDKCEQASTNVKKHYIWQCVNV